MKGFVTLLVIMIGLVYSLLAYGETMDSPPHPAEKRIEQSCGYPVETKANSKLIQAALGNNAEQCVTFPYLAQYGKPEPVMPLYHAGIDLRANYQAAYAVVGGTVMVDCGRSQKKEETACTDSMGIVMIETEINGSKSRVSYVHMSESFVSNGMSVIAGKTKVGTTGNRFNFDPNGAGEPHLHIEVRPGYPGTSAVGFISCHPDDRCDTKEKVQAITMNPMQLVQYQAADVGNLTTNSKLEIDGIGPVKIGMTVSEASKAIGRKLERGYGMVGGNCYYFEPKNGPKGVSFMVIGGHIARIDIENRDISTIEGARIGSTDAEIEKMYPGTRKATPNEWFQDVGDFLTFRSQDAKYSNYRLNFHIENGRVWKFGLVFSNTPRCPEE